jgi:hypothetical protein
VSEVEGWGSPRRVRRALCFQGLCSWPPEKDGPPPLVYFQIFALTRHDEISVEFAFW